MYRPRIIPVLLLKNKGLVKSVRFKDHRYIGDPMNAVKIFNDFKADELVFLDIEANSQNRLISLDLVKDIGEEANMPFSVGGGIRSLDDIRKIIAAGAERVVLNSIAVENPGFVREAAEAFGSSTISVCVDVKNSFFGGKKVVGKNGSKTSPYEPLEFARLMEKQGAGEIILQSVENDGAMGGYDLDLIKRVSAVISIPLVALGGAGNELHLKEAFKEGASALAAGSMFVYQGKNKGVLLSYTSNSDLM